MARQNRLDDSEFCKLVAEVYLSGVGRKEAGEQLQCHPDTMIIWVKDPRVAAHIRRGAKERVNRISRRIDGEIEARMAHVSDWEIDQLLKVRKEYLDRPLKLEEDGGASEAGATNEVAELMDSHPDMAQELLELLKNAGKKPALPAVKE